MTTLNLIEMTETATSYKFLTIVLFLAGLTLIFSGFCILANDDEDGGKAILAGCIVLAISIILIGVSDSSIFQISNGKYQIEATFSEDMPFLSVMKEYDIVEQRGDIFVLEPKEREID